MNPTRVVTTLVTVALLGAGAALAAQNVETNAVVNNVAPVLGSAPSFADAVTPVAGGVVSFLAELPVSDGNGHQDLIASAALSGPGGLNRALPAVLNAGGTPDAATLAVTVDMNYWDSPGLYTITYSVNDQHGVANAVAAQTTSSSFTYDSLLALHVDAGTPTLAFSTLNPGANAEDDLKIWNYGNTAMDIAIDVGDFSNGDSVIPQSALTWSTSPTPNGPGPNSGDGVADTNTPVGPPAGPPSPWSMLYFDLAVPNVMPGTYTGTLTLAAQSA